MKTIIILLFGLLPILAQSSLIFEFKEVAKDLDLNISSSKTKYCRYTRSHINKFDMSKKYKTVKYKRGQVTSKDRAKDWGCIFLRRNIKRDILKRCVVPAAKVFYGKYEQKSVRPTSSLLFVGVYPGKYKYTISNVEGKLQASVNVYFNPKGISEDELPMYLDRMELKFKAAENRWRSFAPDYFDFKFRVVRNKSLADYEVNLVKGSTRGPYFREWSTRWGSYTISHELGHMMGLDDEYDNIAYSTLNKPTYYLTHINRHKRLNDSQRRSYANDKTSKCDKDSMMCTSGSNYSKAKMYHYYLIFRRFFCY